MPRVNVYLPDELADELSRSMPDLNLSRAVQEAIRSRLECDHDALACVRCSRPLERRRLVDDTASRFYAECLGELEPLVNVRGTAEGAAQLLKRVAVRWGLAKADVPLPRPARAARRGNVRSFPMSDTPPALAG